MNEIPEEVLKGIAIAEEFRSNNPLTMADIKQFNLGFTDTDFYEEVEEDAKSDLESVETLAEKIQGEELPIRTSKMKAIGSMAEIQRIEQMPLREVSEIVNDPTHPDRDNVRKIRFPMKGGSKAPAKSGKNYKTKARVKMELLISNVKEHRQRGVPDAQIAQAIGTNFVNMNIGQCMDTLTTIMEKNREKILPIDVRYQDIIERYSGMAYEVLDAELLDCEREQKELEQKMIMNDAIMNIISNEINRRSSDAPTIKFIQSVILQAQIKRLSDGLDF